MECFIALALFSPFLVIGILEYRSHNGYVKYTCKVCGDTSRPRDDRRWHTEIRGSGPETCEEYWVHDCDGER